jgi:protein-tyrosine-phosphatase
MKKKRVLFVCVHNSARSQMAEAFLNTMAGQKYEAVSAGLEPGELNPLAVEVMREVGIDISRNKTKSAFDLPLLRAELDIPSSRNLNSLTMEGGENRYLKAHPAWR